MKHLAFPGSVAAVIIAFCALWAFEAWIAHVESPTLPERVLCVKAVADECDDLPSNPMEFASCVERACGEPTYDPPKQVQDQDQDPVAQEGQDHAPAEAEPVEVASP